MTASQRGTLWAAILGSGIVFLDGTILTVVLPRIGADLPATALGVLEGQAYVVSGYLATLAAFLILGGTLSDHRGRRRVFLVGLVGFGATSLLCGLSPTMEFLVVGRLLQGVAGALLVPGSLAVISSTFHGPERGRAFGIWAAATSVVATAGPPIGGILVELAGWRVAFLINLPVVAIGLWLTVRWMRETVDVGPKVRLDWLGVATGVVAVGGLVFGIIHGRERDWADPLSIVAIGAGILATISFPILMARRADPLVPLDLFRDRRFATLNLATLLVYGAFYASLTFCGLFLQGTLGYSPLGAALALLPLGIFLSVLSSPFGTLAGRTGTRVPLVVGPFLMAAGMAWWAQIPSTAAPWRASLADPALLVPPIDVLLGPLPAMSLFGIGIALVVAPLTTALMACVPATRSGIASAINNAVSRIGQPLVFAAVFVLVTGTFRASIAAAVPGFDPTDPALRSALQPLNAPDPALGEAVAAAARVASTDAFHVVAWLCAGLLVLGAVVNWIGLRDTESRPAH